MRILLVNDYGFMLGGAEKYVFNLKKGLEKKGHKVFIVSSNYKKKKFISDYQILESGHCFNLDSCFNIINFFQFKKILKKIKPDMVHLNNIFYRISPSILFALKKYKTLITLHDYYPICAKDKTLPNLDICKYKFGKNCHKKGCIKRTQYIKESIKRYIIKKGLKNVNLFISPSKYLKDEYKKNKINNIIVLPNPCDFDNIKPSKSRNSDNLLFMGRLAEQKGIRYLIKAMTEIIKKHPKVVLNIAGTGLEEKNFKKLVNKLNLNKNVKFLGWTDGKKKESIIKNSLINIMPSIWPENDGLVKYEVAKYGKATIASNIGGFPEFIKEGKTGFLIPPKDSNTLAKKIIYVLNNKNILNKIRANLIDKIEEHKLDNYIITLEKIYKNLK